MIVLLTPVSVF
jgi:hypothetical protein